MNTDLLIERLKERLQFAPAVECDKHCGYCNDAGEVLPTPRPNPPISHADVDHVERQLGFRLPSLVRRLSTEVADGGYGPDWGINRLRHPRNVPFDDYDDARMSVEGLHAYFQRDTSPEGQAWLAACPRHFIRYCEVGCNISVCVDCTTETGALFLDDPNLGEDQADCIRLMPESLEEWLWKWLNENEWPSTPYPDVTNIA